MKNIFLYSLSLLILGTFFLFQNCDKKSTEETAKDRTLRILQSKQWTAVAVVVPDESATDADQWEGSFKVSFTASNMTTSGHAPGAQAVWPSGPYTVENGTQIIRGDDIVMNLNPISEDAFTAVFSIFDEDLGGGRLSSLDGQYTFGMGD